MWTFLPSTAKSATQNFFSFDDFQRAARSAGLSQPILRGKIWGGEDRNQGWTIECNNFAEFEKALAAMGERIDFLAFDESSIDDDILRYIHEDLRRYASDENIALDTVNKAVSALRGHEGEMFAVLGYAFLRTGQVLFVRVQTELATLVSQPERLLSPEGLAAARKLRELSVVSQLSPPEPPNVPN